MGPSVYAVHVAQEFFPWRRCSQILQSEPHHIGGLKLFERSVISLDLYVLTGGWCMLKLPGLSVRGTQVAHNKTSLSAMSMLQQVDHLSKIYTRFPFQSKSPDSPHLPHSWKSALRAEEHKNIEHLKHRIQVLQSVMPHTNDMVFYYY